MKESTRSIFKELFENYKCLTECENSIMSVYNIILECYKNGGKVLVCGNGGSAADCEHIVGELMKGFNKKRELQEDLKEKLNHFGNGKFISDNLQGALPAISLVSHTGLMTAFINDVKPELVFAQQVLGYLKENDVLISLSTSGDSQNVVNAAITAKALGGRVVSVTGKFGGNLKNISDECICLPSDKTYKIQELTLPVYHAICAMLECELF